MPDKEAILLRAHEWAEKNVPAECPSENCTAVNNWKLGEVGTYATPVHYNKEQGHAEGDKTAPKSHVVPIICGRCGRDHFHYEEEEG
jgi:hypothetical protein